MAPHLSVSMSVKIENEKLPGSLLTQHSGILMFEGTKKFQFSDGIGNHCEKSNSWQLCIIVAFTIDLCMTRGISPEISLPIFSMAETFV